MADRMVGDRVVANLGQIGRDRVGPVRERDVQGMAAQAQESDGPEVEVLRPGVGVLGTAVPGQGDDHLERTVPENDGPEGLFRAGPP
jgi:hypothetical protein